MHQRYRDTVYRRRFSQAESAADTNGDGMVCGTFDEYHPGYS